MTFVSITCKLNSNGTLAVGHQADVQSAASGAAADEATVATDITAALANGTISGDSTALGLVTAIQTDFATLVAALAPAATTADVLLSYNATTVATKNQLIACLNAIIRAVKGSADLT